MNNYLIPANANRGKLLLGYFRVIDLIIFVVGIILSFIFMLTFNLSNVWIAILAIAPGIIAGLLVFPLPHYHNTLVFIQELIEYLRSQKIYHWRGWCYKNGGK